MMYSEFLAGTGAVESPETYAEFQRVEQIYMESEHMTKADAYRMAVVETVEQHEAKMAAERKKELAWVKENIIPAAAFIRGMSEKQDYFRRNFTYLSPAGNLFELRLERNINCGSVMMYSFWCNEKKIDTRSTGYGLLPSSEFQSYRADWHDKTLGELEALFGYIA